MIDNLQQRGHPLESSGQAGSCVFLIFYSKNQVLLFFKLTLNMTMHPVMTSIGVNMHQSPIWESLRGHPLESSGQAGSCVFLIFLFKKPSVVTF